jgi:hypothetical protein
LGWNFGKNGGLVRAESRAGYYPLPQRWRRCTEVVYHSFRSILDHQLHFWAPFFSERMFSFAMRVLFHRESPGSEETRWGSGESNLAGRSVQGRQRDGMRKCKCKCEELHQSGTGSSRMRRARRLLDTLRLYDDGTRKKTRPSNSTIISLTSFSNTSTLDVTSIWMQENSMLASKRGHRRPLHVY